MIRPFAPADAEAVLAINQANVPEVGSIDLERLALLADLSPFFRVIETEAGLVGFIIGLTEDATAYPSKNYAWFVERYDNFAYVDRIAINENGRGQGWGPALYTEFEQWANENGRSRLTAEVNTVPDNPRSHHFHRQAGFVEVGRQRPYGPEEEVAMYSKDLTAEI